MAATPPSTVEPVGPAAVALEGDVVGADGRLLGSAPEQDLPYPGLRAFASDELDIFFGRDAAIDAMLDRLAETKFLAVLGPSGCGKTSLVRTGLYNMLMLGLLPHAGGRWRIAEFGPERKPMRNLAHALVRATGRRERDGDLSEAQMVDLITAHLQRGPRSVVELVEGGLLGDEPGWNLLIVVDQFEQLLGLRDYGGREAAEAAIELLLESARSPLPIHVVITMRTEYFAVCSLIPGLAEQISAGMYLTPRMTRAECRQAIEGPARIHGLEVEAELVVRILNDLDSFVAADPAEDLDSMEELLLQADQLPLMQHVLNHMWRRAEQNKPSDGRLAIGLSDYDYVGGLKGALDNHGRQIIRQLEAELGKEVTLTVERLFRALVDGPSLPLAVRRPRPLDELVVAVGGERAEVAKIVDAFSRDGRNFLRTSEGRLGGDVLVDLGHASLIRCWSPLSRWFAAEVHAAAMWRRLTRQVEFWEQGEGDLLRDLSLRQFTDWWFYERPSPYIALRYGGDFASTARFLDASVSAERRAKRGRMLRIAILGILVVSILVLTVWMMSLT